MVTTTECYCFRSPCIGITLGIQRSRGIRFHPCLVIFEDNNGKSQLRSQNLSAPQIPSLQLRSQHPSSRANIGHDVSIPASKQ